MIKSDLFGTNPCLAAGRREPTSFFLFQNLLHAWTKIVAPVAQLLDDGDEGSSKVGEAVFGMTAYGVNDLFLHDAILYQLLLLLGKHALAGLRHAALELTGTLRTVEQFVDDVRLPLTAHHLDGDTETAVDVNRYLLVIHSDAVIIRC